MTVVAQQIPIYAEGWRRNGWKRNQGRDPDLNSDLCVVAHGVEDEQAALPIGATAESRSLVPTHWPGPPGHAQIACLPWRFWPKTCCLVQPLNRTTLTTTLWSVAHGFIH